MSIPDFVERSRNERPKVTEVPRVPKFPPNVPVLSSKELKAERAEVVLLAQLV